MGAYTSQKDVHDVIGFAVAAVILATVGSPVALLAGVAAACGVGKSLFDGEKKEGSSKMKESVDKASTTVKEKKDFASRVCGLFADKREQMPANGVGNNGKMSAHDRYFGATSGTGDAARFRGPEACKKMAQETAGSMAKERAAFQASPFGKQLQEAVNSAKPNPKAGMTADDQNTAKIVDSLKAASAERLANSKPGVNASGQPQGARATAKPDANQQPANQPNANQQKTDAQAKPAPATATSQSAANQRPSGAQPKTEPSMGSNQGSTATSAAPVKAAGAATAVSPATAPVKSAPSAGSNQGHVPTSTGPAKAGGAATPSASPVSPQKSSPSAGSNQGHAPISTAPAKAASASAPAKGPGTPQSMASLKQSQLAVRSASVAPSRMQAAVSSAAAGVAKSTGAPLSKMQAAAGSAASGAAKSAGAMTPAAEAGAKMTNAVTKASNAAGGVAKAAVKVTVNAAVSTVVRGR